LSLFHLFSVLLEDGLVDLDFWRSQGRGGNELERLVANQLPGEPEERLFEVVVGLGRDVVVLQVLLAMEGDGLSLDFALLDIDLVAAQNNGDVLANPDKITVPVWHVFVCDAGGHIEHDDTALAVDVIAITKTTKLLLTCSVPNIKLNLAQVRCETKGMNLDSEGGNVLLFELAGKMALDECGFASASVANKDELEGGDVGLCFSHTFEGASRVRMVEVGWLMKRKQDIVCRVR